ncbi:hypothetical protein [Psychromonas hadalis]|uniref:hypothetical protein n=1 Tax=Psychromonas hadalis TaxID=211669 RepID=UPI0003B54ED9|nr:hypothetical protein [Psychromonas hadalis]
MKILLNKPLVTQHKKIKSLYKRFGTEATRSKQEQLKIQNQLDELYEDSYRIEQLNYILQSEKDKLDKYAQEIAKNATRCPKCTGRGRGCELCTAPCVRIVVASKFN